MRVNLREVEKLVGSWQPPSQQMELTLVGQELQGRRGEVRLGPRKHGVRSASRAHPCPAVHRSWCKYDPWACSPPPLRATRLCRQRRSRRCGDPVRMVEAREAWPRCNVLRHHPWSGVMLPRRGLDCWSERGALRRPRVRVELDVHAGDGLLAQQTPQ